LKRTAEADNGDIVLAAFNRTFEELKPGKELTTKRIVGIF